MQRERLSFKCEVKIYWPRYIAGVERTFLNSEEVSENERVLGRKNAPARAPVVISPRVKI